MISRKIRRIAITGPTGAIGVALIQLCIEKDIEVIAICRKESKRIERIPKHPLVKRIYAGMEELSELAETEDLCKKWDIKGSVDAFYHFAWEATIGGGRNDMKLQTRNISYAIDAVRLAKKLGCQVFVGAGSQAEYGRVEGKLRADTPTSPENGYGMAKLCAGQMSRIECEKLEMDHVWTRVLSIYGPCDGEMTMITSVIRTLLRGEKPSLTPGEQMWDYLYSKDVARAMLLVAEHGVSGKIYPIGSGKVRSLKEYVEILRDAVCPGMELGFGLVPYGKKQVMYLCADISELIADTGFVPEYDFETGIRETVEWVKENS